MELKSVEIVGFKSFADKLVLTFDGGITGIVGPNGSGKSNVADAIRWVLGEQSAKNLRGTRMEDVIFSGTQRRRPMGAAQVTMVIDNRDRALACDYDEVAISRKMYRSGESEYLLNGTRCRLRDVQELLMDTGIGKDGYSIIAQGRIDQLLSSNPQDRRMIFEEAAGIVKYKKRRDEANKSLVEEQANIQRVTDILGEASSRLEPLAHQADQAREYLMLSEELKKLELQTFLRQYDQYKQQYEQACRSRSDLDVQLEQERCQQAERRRLVEALETEARRAAEKAGQTLQRVNDLRLSQESESGERRLQGQQLQQYRKSLSNGEIRLEEVRARLQRRTRTCEKEKNELQELRERLEKQNAAQEQAIRDRENVNTAYQESLQELAAINQELEEARKQVEAGVEELARVEALQDKNAQEQDERSDQLQSLKNEVSEKHALAEEAQKKLEEGQKSYQAARERVQALTDEISAIRAEMTALSEETGAEEKKYDSLRSRLNWLSELDRDYEGYNNAVRVLMQTLHSQNRMQGVHGTIAELMRVSPKVAAAIDIALGPAQQNIVVDHPQTAQELIGILHQKKAGRATFLPLSEMHERGRREAGPLSMEGVLGYADELIEFDPQYRAVFSRLLGNCLIVDTYPNASQAARRYGQSLRFVTLRGDSFNIGGSITGGSISAKNTSIMNRKSEQESVRKALSESQERLEVLKKQAEDKSTLRYRKNDEMKEISNRRDNLSYQITLLQSEYDQARVRQQVADDQLAEYEKRHSVYAQSLEEGENLLQHLQRQLEKERQQQKSIEEKLEKAVQVREEQRRTAEALRGEVMRLRIEVSTSAQLISSMEYSLEREESENEQDRQSLQSLETQQQQAREQIVRLEKQLADSEGLLKEIREKIEQDSAAIEELNRIRDEKEKQHRQALHEYEEQVGALADLEKEAFRLESQENHANKELTELQDGIWEKYELTYHQVETMGLPEMDGVGKTSRRIGEIHSAIRQMGPINVNAIEEYDALKQRCSFLDNQLSDIRKAENSLREIIAQLTEQMEVQFREGFSVISEQFNQVFSQMFGGGNGKLVLSDTSNPLESGIEIIAQPPGKALKNMTALSGGERALTAIAILFAIQQLKPAPFCILDEIEAALDDANVSRFANYLKNLCKTTQFIVITHRKGTMEAAASLYGITMEEKGISRCVSVKFE